MPYDPVTPERLRRFLERLGRAYRQPGRIYLVGGTSLLYQGLEDDILGLMREWGRDEEQGDSCGGILARVAPPGADLVDTAAAQQVERRLPQQRHDRWPLPAVDQAGIF